MSMSYAETMLTITMFFCIDMNGNENSYIAQLHTEITKQISVNLIGKRKKYILINK